MAINVLMPALSPTMEDGALSRWLVKEGDAVAPGDVIAEIETDKATMEVEAVDEGRVGKLLVAEGAEGVKINTVIAVLLEEGETEATSIDAPPAHAASAPREIERAPSSANAPVPASPKPVGERVFASPLARRLAETKGVDPARIKGTGPHGRVVKADIEAASAPSDAPQHAPASTMEQNTRGLAPAPIATSSDERIELDGMRKVIAQRLTEAKQTIPHFYLRMSIRLDALLELRASLNERLAARGAKLSVNDFIIKASGQALADEPECNAIWGGDHVLRLGRTDVAVAVAVEGGLFTPIIRNAGLRSLSDISSEMKALAEKARNRRLNPSEYQGGAFAVSNLGMFGIDSFDAVINPPHASILAVGAGVRQPVVDADELSVATVMQVTLSVDHRVIDGALGARFLKAIKDRLEDPLSVLI